jgi:hypothetical protein
MASSKLVKECFAKFSAMSNRNISHEAEKALFSAYITAFQGIKDSDLQKAVDSYIKDGQYFPPRPSELISIMPKGSAVTDESEYRIRPGTMCNVCHHFGLCIQEPAVTGQWVCRQCYSGLTKDQYETNMRALQSVQPGKLHAKYDSTTKRVLTFKPAEKPTAADIFGEDN